MSHTLFENTKVTPIVAAAGTIIGATASGTAQGTVNVSEYEYNALCYVGTMANTGTFFVYGMGAGLTSILLGSAIVGSSNGNFVWEIKADAFNSALAGGTGGTAHNQLGVNVAVDSGGTWRGAAFWLQTWPRTAGTAPSALGWAAVGTTLT